MKISKLFVRFFVFPAAFLLMGAVGLADTIKLKDGSVFKGKVIAFNQRKFIIVVRIGNTSSQYSVAADDVESIEFDTTETVAGAQTPPRGGANPPAFDVAPAPRNDPPANVAPVESASQPRVATKEPVSTPPPSTQSAPISNNSRPTPPANEPRQSSPPVGSETGLIATIAEKSVSVPAAADWTSTEIRIQKGQRIVINASGEIELGNNQVSSPDGIPGEDARKLMAKRPTGALIAVVGDDNDDFIYVGKSTEFIAAHNGILFLSVNEGNLKDNNGAYIARVKVLSNK